MLKLLTAAPRVQKYLAPALLFVVALALRLWWASPFAAEPVWGDPDGYLWMAQSLGIGSQPWRWTRNAIVFAEFFKAPLYQTMLSALTTHAISFVTWGLTLHAVLNACTVWALYFVGRSMHSWRAGLIAAAVYAVWVPNIRLTTMFWQEHLYVPLLVSGLALLAVAIDREQGPARWALAGVVFGAAALTRSAVLYFLPVAALSLMVWRRERRARLGVLALVVAFAAVTLPYVAVVSQQAGRFVPIEDVGYFSLKRWHPVSLADPTITLQKFMRNDSSAPTGVEAARFLLADFAAGPALFLEQRLEILRLLFKPQGSAFLGNSVAADRRAARLLKLAVHLGFDLPFVLAAVLCPLGIVLSRRPEVAALLAIWCALLSLLMAVTLWAGFRYRAPMEPMLVALASIVVAGQWRRPTRAALASAVACALALASLIGWGIESGLRTQPAYGVSPWPVPAESDVTFHGAAGLMIPGNRELHLHIRRVTDGDDGDGVLKLWLNGRPVDELPLPDGQGRELRYPLRAPGGAYIEFAATSGNGHPAAMALRVLPITR